MGIFDRFRRSEDASGELEAGSQRENVVDMIKGYLDKRGWNYQKYTDEESVVTFRLSFSGANEKVYMKVDVIKNGEMYHVAATTDTMIHQGNLMNGIMAINEYNLHANVVSGCVKEDGMIIFWLGKNIADNAFSEEAFEVDLYMVLREADYQSAHIFKKSFVENVECYED